MTWSSFFTRILWGALSTLMTLAVLAILAIMLMAIGLPDVATLKDVHMQVPMTIYSSDGKLMGEFGIKKRIPVTLDQVPPTLVHAVIATEDARFYSHSGIDIISIARAAKAVLQSGKKVQGASTITMQVARNFFLDRKKTYGRKIREMILAMKINHDFSKNKILEIYLNKIYLGSRAYGVAAAAQVYYGKPLNALTLPQMAMLAGLPQAPSAHNPLTHPKDARIRRNHVLARMLEQKYITQAEYQQAIQAPVTASYHDEDVALDAPYATEVIRKQLYAQYGDRIYEDGFKVTSTINSHLQQAAQKALILGAIRYSKLHGYRHAQLSLGLFTPDAQTAWQNVLHSLATLPTIQPAAVTNIMPQSIQVLLANGQMVTIPWQGLSWARPYQPQRTLPGPAPKTAADIVNPGDVIYVTQLPNQQWALSQYPEVQGALVSLDPNNGAILAMVGGLNYQLSHFNRVTQAVRQPGSGFKPFIYSAALAKGKTLATMINDAPIVIADSGENTFWRPQNDTLKFYGPTSVRMALIHSRNVVSVRLLQMIGLPYALNYLKHFGFDTATLPHTLSLALGSGGVTPLKLAQGYTVFANGGYTIEPHLIAHISDEQGHSFQQYQYPVVPQNTPVASCNTQTDTDCTATLHVLQIQIAPRTISPQITYLMTTAMQGVIQKGTGRRALSLHRQDLAGKTGTTNNQVDAWFSGFNHAIETTVWLGFDDNQRSLHEYASSSALPIWIHYMQTALQGIPDTPLTIPPGLVTVRIDPKTGLLAPENDPNGQFETFRQETVPTQYATDTALQTPSAPDTASAQTGASPSETQSPLF